MNPLETQTNVPSTTQYEINSIAKDNPFSPKGRFSRLSYLAWMLIVGILYTFTLFIIAAIAGVSVLSSGIPSPAALLQTGFGNFVIFLFVVVVIVFTVLSICISIRRIHDLNKSGWLWLLFLIPIVNIIFGLYILFAKGTEGPNNYGSQRITEQTEKLLGTIYAIFLAIFIVAYGAIGIWYYKMMNSIAQMDHTELTERNDLGIEQEVENAENQLKQSADQIQHQADAVEESSEAVDQSAEDAVRAATEAAEAAGNQVNSDTNHDANQR